MTLSNKQVTSAGVGVTCPGILATLCRSRRLAVSDAHTFIQDRTREIAVMLSLSGEYETPFWVLLLEPQYAVVTPPLVPVG